MNTDTLLTKLYHQYPDHMDMVTDLYMAHRLSDITDDDFQKLVDDKIHNPQRQKRGNDVFDKMKKLTIPHDEVRRARGEIEQQGIGCLGFALRRKFGR